MSRRTCNEGDLRLLLRIPVPVASVLAAGKNTFRKGALHHDVQSFVTSVAHSPLRPGCRGTEFPIAGSQVSANSGVSDATGFGNCAGQERGSDHYFRPCHDQGADDLWFQSYSSGRQRFCLRGNAWVLGTDLHARTIPRPRVRFISSSADLL